MLEVMGKCTRFYDLDMAVKGIDKFPDGISAFSCKSLFGKSLTANIDRVYGVNPQK